MLSPLAAIEQFSRLITVKGHQMPDVLVAAFIADAADNQIDDGSVNAVELGYSDNGSAWGFAPVEATSTSAVGLAVLGHQILGDQIWVADRAGSGSNIFTTSSSVGFAAFTGQSSAVAPAMTVLGDGLALAYIGASTSRVEVITSANGSSWSAKSITGQSSHVAPALAVLSGTLWLAYVGEATGHVELISWANGTTWTSKVDLGQPTDLSPAMAVSGGALWIAYVNSSTGAIEVLSYDGQTSTPPVTTGQTSSYGPALTTFNGVLWLAYIGKDTGHLELVSFDGESTWSSKIDTGRSSQCSPALTTIPAATGPSPLIGHSQYVLTGSPALLKYEALPPLLGVTVQITITEDLKFDPSLPPGFQLNCYSAADNQTLGVQQYVLIMQPGSKGIGLHLQNFPPASVIAAYGGNSPNLYTFTDLGVIPKGLTFTIQLDYASEDGVSGSDVSGMSCTVTNADGASLGHQSVSALHQKLASHPGYTDDSWLAPIVAMELDVTGYGEGKNATLTAGHGFIVYSSSLPLQANALWYDYVNSPKNGTKENSNCVNGLIPVGTTYGVVQSFGVPDA
jgi:hypothetical protein